MKVKKWKLKKGAVATVNNCTSENKVVAIRRIELSKRGIIKAVKSATLT